MNDNAGTHTYNNINIMNSTCREGDEGLEMKALVTSSDDPSTQEEEETGNPHTRTAISMRTLSYARKLLYISHLFAQFSEAAWQFSVAIFLAACTNYQSLILVSTYGIALNLSVCATATFLGNWVDRADRLHVARRLIPIQNMAVLLGTLCCWLLLSSTASNDEALKANPAEEVESTAISKPRFSNVPRSIPALVALVGIHVFGSMAQLLDRAFLVAIERDWVVVLSQASGEKHFTSFLSDTNVAMKQIDLSCKVVAPGIAGLAISMIGNLQWACLVVGGITLMALLVEYTCTTQIYNLIPALSSPKQPGE